MIPRKNNKPSQESKEETIKKENLERFNENVLSIVIMFSVVMSVILFANKQYLYMLFFLPMTLFADSIFNFVKKFKDHVYDITSTADYTYFPYTFYEKGTFKFTVYSKEYKYINFGTVEIIYK